MKYMGSKNRIAKEILPIVLKDKKPDQWYVEPFCGGCNIIDKVEGLRIANDSNFYIIEMFKKIQEGWIPEKINKKIYSDIKNNKDKYDPYIVGWVGIGCSYSGKWFGGFAGKVKTKIGTIRDYQEEAIKNIVQQSKNLIGIDFKCCNYLELNIPNQSIIYCDPPYQGTTEYRDNGFNHIEYWNWIREMVKKGHQVFCSEYNAPEDFICVWEKELKSSLSANGKYGGNKNSFEKLFVYNVDLL